MTLPPLSAVEWLLAAAAALGVGLSKAGLAGIGLFHVVVFAFLFGARESTGYVLPLLVAGDVCAVVALHQHVRWEYVRRMLLPACIGVVLAALVDEPDQRRRLQAADRRGSCWCSR